MPCPIAEEEQQRRRRRRTAGVCCASARTAAQGVRVPDSTRKGQHVVGFLERTPNDQDEAKRNETTALQTRLLLGLRTRKCKCVVSSRTASGCKCQVPSPRFLSRFPFVRFSPRRMPAEAW